MAATSSAMTPYSIGIVAINKKLDSDEIEAAPIEDLIYLSGEITDNMEKMTVSGQDSKGSSYSSTVEIANTVRAKWTPMGTSYQKTAPDVRRGEKVQLWRVGDSQLYYWTVLENDGLTRRLETVHNAVSATREEDIPLSENNSYSWGVDTHKKYVNIISTSKADKEKWKYDINVDVAAGIVTITDDIDNTIKIDSGEHQIYMRNTEGSYFDMTKHVIKMYAKDLISLESDKEIKFKSKDRNEEHTTVNTEAPTHNHKGDYKQQGDYYIAGGIAGSPGNGTSLSDAYFDYDIKTKRDVLSNGGAVSLNKHAHNNSGGPGVGGTPVGGG